MLESHSCLRTCHWLSLGPTATTSGESDVSRPTVTPKEGGLLVPEHGYTGLPKLGVQLLGVPQVGHLPGGSIIVKELELAVK